MPMLPQLRELFVNLGAHLDAAAGDRIDHLGGVEDEYRALCEGCGFYLAADRGGLRLTGSDRVDFLHGMTTNDVKKLPVGGACAAAMVTAKGRMVALVRVVRRADDLLVDTDADRVPAMREFLDHHLISEDVELHDASADAVWFSLVGPRAAAAFGAIVAGGGSAAAARAPDRAVELERGALAIGARLGDLPRIDVRVPAAEAASWAAAALERGVAVGLRPVGFAAMEIARVEAGEPRFGHELNEETIPLEAALERAISYDKGCYVGQEVIARASYRGAVRRRLCALAFEGGDDAHPATKAPLFKALGDPKPAGEVTSVVRSPRAGVIGLGFVRREHLASQPAELVTNDGVRLTAREVGKAVGS